ncbi:hypothetical protein DPSP01_008441 [Paraphaeosphaeria sporulosa]
MQPPSGEEAYRIRLRPGQQPIRLSRLLPFSDHPQLWLKMPRYCRRKVIGLVSSFRLTLLNLLCLEQKLLQARRCSFAWLHGFVAKPSVSNMSENNEPDHRAGPAGTS